MFLVCSFDVSSFLIKNILNLRLSSKADEDAARQQTETEDRKTWNWQSQP